ncbi:ataxin-10 [Trichonephila clavipes]|nr:ataxin-10 [Trichonephila clavipes]
MVNNTANEHISQLISLLNISGTSYDAVTASLQKMTALMQSFDTRCDLSNDHWKPIEAVAKECRQFLTKNEISEGELSLLIELLRFLRNSCGGLNENLNYVLGHDDLLSLAKESIRYFIEKKSPKAITALKIAVQLFGNILVSSEHSKPLVWDLFFRENKFRDLFQHGDVTIRECAMMVLFNSMSDENSECIFSSKEGHEIIFFVTDTLLFNQIDWGTRTTPIDCPWIVMINQLGSDQCTWPWGHCLLSELREWRRQTGRHNGLRRLLDNRQSVSQNNHVIFSRVL